MKRLIGLFLILMVGMGSLVWAEQAKTFTEQMEKLQPLVGKWKTRSVFPGKNLEVPGELEYRWVLGKNWLRVEFVGQHPERSFWEAYVMIKFDTAKNLYIAYAFFNADDPVIEVGSWISDKTFRLESRDDKGKTVGAIDYTVKEDGTIYQENWVIDKNNQKQITLKTYYTR